ncbi:MAG TPA: ABC transporter ATP-binding protein [Candidatus Paceibacterota bacterium]|nr:ABC transporter ATP-binding protein [Candidatus Paceibacterota bacterium]
MSDDTKREIVPAGRILRAYAPELGKHPGLFVMVMVGMAGIVATDLIAPLYLKQFFNAIAGTDPTTNLVAELSMIITIVIALYVANWVAFRAYSIGLINLELKAMSRLYNHAFDYLIRHSQHFFTSQFTGTLTRRVAKFSDAFETLVDTVFMQFVPTAIFVVGAVIVLATQHPWLGGILAVWSVIFIIVQIWLANLRQPLREAQSRAESERTGATADALSNQSAITQFAAEEAESRKLADVVARWRQAAMRSWGADEFIWAVLGLLMIGIQAALLYAAVELWSRGLLTVGDFVLIQAYLITTFERLIGINRDLRRFYAGLANASEMITILDTDYDIKDAAGARELVVDEGSITFEDVSFGYQDRPTLAGFSLSIPSHQKVALVGPSGAGKSTITKLLLRLYDVTGGTIRIDGQDIREVTQESLRKAISFVPQEPALFHRSLRENISYGRPDASEAEIIEAAKKAHCHEFIAGLPLGYETYVGERGVKLSGGERQRVAIARAILKDAPILVLDEATSSLDSESESLIQDALRTLMAGKTVVVIAHRLSTIMSMDRIVVLEGGRVVADGTHDELVADAGGLYHKLWSIQAGGFIAG